MCGRVIDTDTFEETNKRKSVRSRGALNFTHSTFSLQELWQKDTNVVTLRDLNQIELVGGDGYASMLVMMVHLVLAVAMMIT